MVALRDIQEERMVHLQGGDLQADSRRYSLSNPFTCVCGSTTQLEGLMQRAIGMEMGYIIHGMKQTVFSYP